MSPKCISLLVSQEDRPLQGHLGPYLFPFPPFGVCPAPSVSPPPLIPPNLYSIRPDFPDFLLERSEKPCERSPWNSSILRGESHIKNVPKSGKSPKGGEGVGPGNQKVHNSKCGLFDIFIFFPNVNAHFKHFSWTKSKLVLKWFLDNFECFKLIFLVLWGVLNIQNFANFNFSPK